MRRTLASITFMLIMSACAGASHERPTAEPSPLDALSLPAAAFAQGEPTIEVDVLRADIEALYEGLQRAHYDLFAHRAKADYDAYYDAMLALDVPLHEAEAKVLFQRFAAYGNVAHARVDFPGEAWRRYREAGGRAFPIHSLVRDGRLYVETSFEGEDAPSPGDEIVSIDGVPAKDVIARAGRNISADTPYLLATQLELSFPAMLWLEREERERFDLVLRSPSGTTRSVTVPALSEGERMADAGGDAEPMRRAELRADGIGYLRPGPFYAVETPADPWNPADFTTFVDAAFEAFVAGEAKAVLIDLRGNPGGDNSFSDPMVAWFADEPFRFASTFEVRSSPEAEASNQERLDANPAAAEGMSGVFAERYAATPYGETFEVALPLAEPREGHRYDGPVFVLIDRYSYSNAVNVAALVQDYGFGRILGEETSDLATTYGAMESFVLPGTGIDVGFPKALIVRPSGDRTPRGVVPDCPIAMAVNATPDKVLDEALEIVRADGC